LFAAMGSEQSCGLNEVLFSRTGDLEDRRSVGSAWGCWPAAGGEIGEQLGYVRAATSWVRIFDT
jgi:hypothetical protein